MVHVDSAFSLVEFARNTPECLARLKSTGLPAILTIEGGAEVIVQDAAAYQMLLDRLDSVEAIAAVKVSMDAFDRGEGLPVREGFAALREKHGLPRND